MKTFEYDRFDLMHYGTFQAAADGEYVLAADAIDREKVNADRIRTLELQLKEARAK